MNIIETKNLSHRYGRTEALHDFSLEVPEGCILALLGPNGAGKTTAIKIIMNLIRAGRGSATVLGVDSRRLSPRQFEQIGYVSENQELPGWMTIRQLIDYTRAFYPRWDQDLEKRLLREFELPESRRIQELSRGMLMKVSLLSSLAYRPRLLVLDEPFSGLDPLVREEFVRGILEVSGFGDWTVLISSHDIEEVERLADTIAMLDAGRLSFTESTESLLQRFRRIEATLDDPGRPPLERPPGCLDWKQEGARIQYVDAGFPAGDPNQARRIPGTSAQAHPMTLREIFISLARHSRAKGGRT